VKWHRAVRRVPFGTQKSYTSRATVPLFSPLCQDKERKDEEDDDEDDDKGDDEERRRKKKTRTVFSRSQVFLLHFFSKFRSIKGLSHGIVRGISNCLHSKIAKK
jgi:hypothetical protein